MMMMNRKIISIILLLSFTIAGYSQNDDFGMWFGIDASHNLVKKFDISLSGCIRTIDNTSRIEQYFVEGGLGYKLNKIFSVSASYRLLNTQEKNSNFYFRHKIFFDLKGTVPVNQFSLSTRLRLQRTTRTYIEDNEDIEAKYYVRLKTKASYNIPSFPLDPFIGCEIFCPAFSDNGLDIYKNRLSVGAELKLSKKNSLSAEYIHQRDYHPSISDINIVSFGYNFKF